MSVVLLKPLFFFVLKVVIVFDYVFIKIYSIDSILGTSCHDLSWKSHIVTVPNIASKQFGVLLRLRECFSVQLTQFFKFH